MTDFKTYRDGAGGRIAKTILGKSIKHLESWNAFFEFANSAGVGDGAKKMLLNAERAYADGHIGERVVILATLFAMDRSGHAVRLETQANENLLGLLNYADAQYREAVAACMFLGGR